MGNYLCLWGAELRIGILYICVGEYHKFWQEFYLTSEKYFCPKIEKKYFIFTNFDFINASRRIEVIRQDDFGWPLNTLYRYKMFLRIAGQLGECDYVIFFNANCRFIGAIDRAEFFGVDKDIVACVHPGFFDKEKCLYTYENRAASTAFVRSAAFYFAGGLMGGKTLPFMYICREIEENINIDFDNGLLALWHDESHWNAYLNNNFQSILNRLQVLSPSYLYPENWDIPFEKKIVLREKSSIINLESVKHNKMLSMRSPLGAIVRKVQMIFQKVSRKNNQHS
jgi:hypothetical protein